jgi:NAD(P)-dependent dehydrogenase (short-subunit alcohol dehydrogenase family)
MSYLEELFSLKGKHAIVTGGGRGIGQVIAVGLAKAGAEIVIISRTGADETVKLIEQVGGKAYSLLADITNESAVDSVLNEILTRSGSIEILFNNAGTCINKGTLDASIAEWREVIDTNLTGSYIMARAVGKIMIERKIKGSIINMASMSAHIVNVPQWQASYNSSKAGIVHMTHSLAAEWSQYGIRVNSLSPGYIGTPMSLRAPKEMKDVCMPLIPAHRMGDPEELIGAVVYLAADSSGYTNGSDLVVDGAYTCL